MSLKTLRVLIIEAHPAVGRALERLVGLMPGLTVVGLAHQEVCGLRLAVEVAPDVAVVDADLPGLCSAATIKLLRSRLPNARVIALGFLPEQRPAALASGAHAFVLKAEGYEALRMAIVHEEDGGAEDSRELHFRESNRDGNQERVASCS